jgi:peroxiredoxin Q/BCP
VFIWSGECNKKTSKELDGGGIPLNQSRRIAWSGGSTRSAEAKRFVSGPASPPVPAGDPVGKKQRRQDVNSRNPFPLYPSSGFRASFHWANCAQIWYFQARATMRKKPMWMAIGGILAAAVLLAVLSASLRGGDKSPAVGTPAPDFTLNSQEGKPISLHDFKGKWVVLYFYPKDMTTGCTIEAHNFQRDLAKYDAKKAVILGVSMQDEKSHQEFCAKESLTFKLLADTNKEVSEKYDSVMNLGVAKLSARHTYLIDPNGVVRRVWTSVDVKTHSDDVLTSLDELQKPSS